jgi:hypothetical protein
MTEKNHAQLLAAYEKAKREFDEYMEKGTSTPGYEYGYQYLYDRVDDARAELEAAGVSVASDCSRPE